MYSVRPSPTLYDFTEAWLDSGIYTAHNEFDGRTSWGRVFGGYSKNDLFGHGTLVAFIAIGAHYGVATAAKAIAVKVINDRGQGTETDLLSGIEWSVRAALQSRRPSIINISIISPPNDALWEATEAGIKAGIHFTACAGNDRVDASTTFAGQGE
jgi:cerevisin